MKKYLLLLTAGFPFGAGEPFLESEIVFHTTRFDKVIIFAQDIDSALTSHRPVPDGVDFYNISVSSKMSGRARDLFHGARACLSRTPEYQSDIEQIGSSLKKRLFLEYFEARSLRHLNEMSRFLESYSFSQEDTVVIYSYWFFAAARSGAMLKTALSKRAGRVLLVSRGHGYDIYDYANSLCYLPERRMLLKDTDRLFVCSDDGCKRMKSLYPEYAHRISRSYLGTPEQDIGPRCGDTFVILTCSRAVPLKRLHRVISSLSLLRNCPVSLKWVHIGDGPELRQLRQLASEKLSFMTAEFAGEISNSAVLEYYKNNPVGVFVNVSSTEGLPVSIMEAMSFGIPAIATDVGGTGELVSGESGGILLDRDFSDEELRCAVESMALMPCEQMQKLRELARSKWKESFCAEKNYSEFSGLLANL